MGEVSYIRRQGRLIEVETIEPKAPAKKRHGGEPFLLLTHRDAVRGFLAVKNPHALVWYALLYRSWAEKAQTVRVPTKLLRSWGLERRVWARALVRLEWAGVIRVERRSGTAARVTLLPQAQKGRTQTAR
jgi:hypothetical protein